MKPESHKSWIFSLKWRSGRSVGRTLYAIVSDKPSDHDILIGIMDTPQLARSVADDHNNAIKGILDRAKQTYQVVTFSDVETTLLAAGLPKANLMFWWHRENKFLNDKTPFTMMSEDPNTVLGAAYALIDGVYE